MRIEKCVEQAINEMVSMLLPPSQRIPAAVLLNCGNDLPLTAKPTYEDTVEDIIAPVDVNNCRGGSGNADDFQDTPCKIKKGGCIVELL